MTDLTPVDRETWLSEEERLSPRYRIDMPVLPYQRRASEGPDFIEVSRDSPLDLRQAAEMFGNAAKRECGYDFPLARALNFGEQRVWLLPAPRVNAVSFVAAGAVAFKLMGGVWELRWMYVHPFERGKQVIDFYWPRFVALYGDFTVQPPVTATAQAVLNRLGWTAHGPRSAA
ncbi:hypothetical protein MXD62_35740 [Frankia sp. Mgl5]|uniref:hypothetical protein n=1 Tax=Frankia sp. Mgl5 TaxID=2933793 RepID=UPI00200D120C|nr:hypothetical protein [Frankia sp. Mgl5]MCK9932434.1 hypothetical protein [Frankia sp. Mgl5]